MANPIHRDDSRDGGDGEQPGRTQPRGEPAAQRKQDDLGEHALGPQQADDVVVDTGITPGECRETVCRPVARLD